MARFDFWFSTFNVVVWGWTMSDEFRHDERSIMLWMHFVLSGVLLLTFDASASSLEQHLAWRRRVEMLSLVVVLLFLVLPTGGLFYNTRDTVRPPSVTLSPPHTHAETCTFSQPPQVITFHSSPFTLRASNNVKDGDDGGDDGDDDDPDEFGNLRYRYHQREIGSIRLL